MSSDITIIRCTDFLRTTASGGLDYDASKALLAEVARAVRTKGIANVLVDVRQAQPSLSTMQLYELGACFATSDDLRGSKTALLTVEGTRYEDAQFMENVVFNRGGHLAAFSSFEKAMEWLVFEDNGAAGVCDAGGPSSSPGHRGGS